MFFLEKIENDLILLAYTIIVGIISGVIIWSFIEIMNLGIYFLWDYLPGLLHFKYYTVVTCLLGGLIIGLFKEKYGDATQELKVVVENVRTNHRYPYQNIFQSIVSALLPLMIGASVGPEAGLTGIIASLCTWASDRLKIFNKELEDMASIGVSATLGVIFASPLFAFVEPIENEENVKLPKTSKNILYFAAILSSFGVFMLLNHLTASNMGMQLVGAASLSNLNYCYLILLMLVGIILGYFYFLMNILVKKLFKGICESYIIKGVIGGLILGIVGTLLPLTMFSGEYQIHILLDNALEISVALLILTSIVKILLTNICIESGLKGGHFFPLIFSGIAMGYAMSMIFNMDPVLSMAIVTTALLANILKKPIAVVLLLMILFPVNLILLMLITAVISCLFQTPKRLQLKGD